MGPELRRLRTVGGSFAVMRILAVPLAAVEVYATDAFPAGYRPWAWATCGVLAAGAAALFVLTWWVDFDLPGRRRVSELAVVFDTLIVLAFIFLYHLTQVVPGFVGGVLVLVLEGETLFGKQSLFHFRPPELPEVAPVIIEPDAGVLMAIEES